MVVGSIANTTDRESDLHRAMGLLQEDHAVGGHRRAVQGRRQSARGPDVLPSGALLVYAMPRPSIGW